MIDLKAIITRRRPSCYTNSIVLDEDFNSLIAEVEMLREKARKAYSEGWDVTHEPAPCGHARANWKDPEFGTPEYKGNEKCEACAEIEALREHVAKLAGVLQDLTHGLPGLLESIGYTDEEQLINKALATLAATPADTLERAKAKDEIITTARCIAEYRAYRGIHSGVNEALRSALARLDALGEAGT